MIQVNNLVFEYPNKRALVDVSFQLDKGSITALVGPNGAGKSTLLRCLAALQHPHAGSISINGFDTRQEPLRVHRSLGFLPDLFGLYDELSVKYCLEYICRCHGVDTSKVSTVITQLKLESHQHKPAGELSRGLRQRLAIGMAIIHQPQVLLLDEPASGLDPEARIDLSELFLQLRQQGMTLVVSSHILAELEDYATDVLILSDGRIIDQHKLDDSFSTEQRCRILMKIQLSSPFPDLQSWLQQQPELDEINVVEKRADFKMIKDEEQQTALLKRLLQADIPVCSFAPANKDLQKVYVEKMQKSRDQGEAQ